MVTQNWKTQTFWSLPVYTGDVSGVCSALYELGGMVVMHDPSGCNSTYNTHDEIRWTSRESLIFLSGLTQMDAITGNDKKLIDDIVQTAQYYHPKFIAIANSPIPWLTGTDFSAICRVVSQKTHIPAFHVETNAMHDYTWGAGQAFLKLAQMLFSENDSAKPITSGDDPQQNRHTGDITKVKTGPDIFFKNAKTASALEFAFKKAAERKIIVNILGMTPLDFTHPGDAAYLVKNLNDTGFGIAGVWAMGSTLEQLETSPEADVNLVVSSAGMYAAGWMEERFGIPYVAGIPAGAFSRVLYEAVQKSAKDHKSRVPYLDVLRECGEALPVRAGTEPFAASCPRTDRCIAGEPVTMGSVAAGRILAEGVGYDLIPLTETVRGLIPEAAPRPMGEQQIRDVLGRYQCVTADPMLREACADGCRFEALPHFALSGRLYLNSIPSIVRTMSFS